jgi:hypothetical protein
MERNEMKKKTENKTEKIGKNGKCKKKIKGIVLFLEERENKSEKIEKMK